MASQTPFLAAAAAVVTLLLVMPVGAQESTGDLLMPETEAAPEATAPDQAEEQKVASREFAESLTVYNQADYPGAVDKFEAYIRAHPDQTEAYFYLGYALYKLKRFDESRIAFAEAYKRQSDYLPPVAETPPPAHNQ